VTTGALFGSAAVPTVASIPLNALKVRRSLPDMFSISCARWVRRLL
jgi:hypothetical protein